MTAPVVDDIIAIAVFRRQALAFVPVVMRNGATRTRDRRIVHRRAMAFIAVRSAMICTMICARMIRTAGATRAVLMRLGESRGRRAEQRNNQSIRDNFAIHSHSTLEIAGLFQRPLKG